MQIDRGMSQGSYIHRNISLAFIILLIPPECRMCVGRIFTGIVAGIIKYSRSPIKIYIWALLCHELDISVNYLSAAVPLFLQCVYLP